MRYVKKSKKSTKKTNMVVRTARKAPLNKSYGNLGLGFPKKIKQIHRYSQFFTLQSTTGVGQNHFFSCNNIFDPDLTAAGHQPLYTDQMFQLYNHATVIGSRIRVRFSPDSSAQGSGLFALSINDDAAATATLTAQSIQEQSNTKYKCISPAGQEGFQTLTANFSTRKQFGKTITSNSLLRNSALAGPVEQSYFQLTLVGFANNTIIASIDVLIEYIVIWSELRDIAGS